MHDQEYQRVLRVLAPTWHPYAICSVLQINEILVHQVVSLAELQILNILSEPNSDIVYSLIYCFIFLNSIHELL